MFGSYAGAQGSFIQPRDGIRWNDGRHWVDASLIFGFQAWLNGGGVDGAVEWGEGVVAREVSFELMLGR